MMFLLGSCIYIIYAWLVFNPAIRGSEYLIPVGLLIALLGNLIWLLIAKATTSSMQLMIYALAWDTMVTITFMVVPILFYGAKISLMSMLGFIVALIGLAFMKIGSL